jgi:hypothetical protein
MKITERVSKRRQIQQGKENRKRKMKMKMKMKRETKKSSGAA